VPRSDQDSPVHPLCTGGGGTLPSRRHQGPAAIPVVAARRRLRHVLWLGGAACSGKTVVASRLCAGYGLAEYHADDSFERLRRCADPRQHAAFCRVGDLSGEALWAAPAAEQAGDLLAFHREHFELVLEELMQAPPERPMLVEGCCLLPECVAPLLSSRRQALWLVASAEFRRLHYPRPWLPGARVARRLQRSRGGVRALDGAGRCARGVAGRGGATPRAPLVGDRRLHGGG
jgi:hypothetical protein